MNAVVSTNVPPPTWSDTGLSIPTQAQILAGCQADISAAAGGNINPALVPIAGQMASSLAAIIWQCYSSFLFLTNNVNPSAAQSFLQDAIGFLFRLTRNPGTPTAVQCNCVGQAAVTIAVGTLAKDTAGNVYACTEVGTFPSDGTLSLSFANIVNGPIPCPAGTLTIIAQSITGWYSITNPEDGIPGRNVESQAAFASRIQASTQVNAQGSAPALYGALAALPGVTAAYVIQNDTAFPMEVGPTDYSLVANSIYAAVVGGTATQIAQTIWTKKSPGCNSNGNQSVTVYDPSYPVGAQPGYPIKYNVPNAVNVTFLVNYATTPPPPSNIVSLVQAAIIQQFEEGTQWIPAVSIASTILQSSYVLPILKASPGLALLSIGIGTAFVGVGSWSTSSTTLIIGSVTSGFMSAGNILTGDGIPTTAYIVTQLTGTPGGAGTYEMSAEPTANGSSAAISSTTGNNSSWQAGIDQDPVIEASNISVTIGVAPTTLTVVVSPTTLSVTGASASETTSAATATPSGGTSPYSYAWSWNTGGTGITINSPSASTTTFTGSGLAAGQTFSGTAQCKVTSTDGQIVTATVAVTIQRVSAPSASASPTSLSVVGASSSETTAPCTVSATGGGTPYTYVWTWQSGGTGILIGNTSAATTSFTATSLSVDETVSGVALCTVTDSYGQTTTATCSVSIERVSAVSASVSPSSLSATSINSSISTGTCTVSASGGSGSYTYAWNWQSGGVDISINSPSAATTNFTGSGLIPGNTYSGTAQCIITDGYGQTTTVTVSVSIEREYLYSGTLVSAATSSGGIDYYGYIAGSQGSISPTTDQNGNTIRNLVWQNDPSSGNYFLDLNMSNTGAPSNYFATLYIDGTPYAMTYQGSGGWTSIVGNPFPTNTSYNVILRQP